MTLPFEITTLIASTAQRYGIDEFLLVAQVIQESGGNPYAVRFEPNYRWLWPTSAGVVAKAPCSVETERVLQMCSWGLLQIMGAVARERGFTGPFLSKLAADPGLALDLGAQHLAIKLGRYANVRDALSAYNAGHPTPDNMGTYVEPIMERADALREAKA